MDGVERKDSPGGVGYPVLSVALHQLESREVDEKGAHSVQGEVREVLPQWIGTVQEVVQAGQQRANGTIKPPVLVAHPRPVEVAQDSGPIGTSSRERHPAYDGGIIC